MPILKMPREMPRCCWDRFNFIYRYMYCVSRIESKAKISAYILVHIVPVKVLDELGLEFPKGDSRMYHSLLHLHCSEIYRT